MTLNILRLLISAPIYLLLLFFYGIPPMSMDSLVIIIFSSLGGFVLGDYFFFSAMKVMGVSRSALIVTLYPVWVIVLGYLWLGREITVHMLLGVAIILTAIILISFKREEIEFRFLGVIYALLAQLLWALAVVATDWLLGDMPVLQVTGLRVIAGASMILLILPWKVNEIKVLQGKELFFVALIALLGTVAAQYTFTLAIDLAGSGIASPVSETSPLLATLLAKIFLKEKVSGRLFLAVVLVVIGVGILMI